MYEILFLTNITRILENKVWLFLRIFKYIELNPFLILLHFLLFSDHLDSETDESGTNFFIALICEKHSQQKH